MEGREWISLFSSPCRYNDLRAFLSLLAEDWKTAIFLEKCPHSSGRCIWREQRGPPEPAQDGGPATVLLSLSISKQLECCCLPQQPGRWLHVQPPRVPLGCLHTAPGTHCEPPHHSSFILFFFFSNSQLPELTNIGDSAAPCTPRPPPPV